MTVHEHIENEKMTATDILKLLSDMSNDFQSFIVYDGKVYLSYSDVMDRIRERYHLGD